MFLADFEDNVRVEFSSEESVDLSRKIFLFFVLAKESSTQDMKNAMLEYNDHIYFFRIRE